MTDTPLIFDMHLDLSMNALYYNRDLRWSLEKIRRWEHIQCVASNSKDKVDRGNNTVCFPEMRRGRVGLCVATLIGRHSSYFHNLPGLLRKRGFSDDDVSGIMWGNTVEFLRRVWE